jgi:tRNA A37 threonylcarbamoyladenosine dehydratase
MMEEKNDVEFEVYSRSALLLGENAAPQLTNKRVALFGVGGVGSYCAEALVRGGIGSLLLVDKDVVAPSNLNRQLCATAATVGMDKVDAMRERLYAIRPGMRIDVVKAFVDETNADDLIGSDVDYVVDAVDTLSAKIALVVACSKRSIPIISAMGAGNKLDGTRFRVADIYSTSVCPLARRMCASCTRAVLKSLKWSILRRCPAKFRRALWAACRLCRG